MKNSGTPARRITSPITALIVVDVKARPDDGRTVAGEQRVGASHPTAAINRARTISLERAGALDERVGTVDRILGATARALQPAEHEFLGGRSRPSATTR